MNSLSWLIYLADVVPGFGTIGRAVLIVSIVGSIISSAVCFFARFDDDDDTYKKVKPLRAFALTALFISALIVVFVPSRQTILLIAASEFGEEIATSAKAEHIGGKAYQALDKFLSDYLEEE